MQFHITEVREMREVVQVGGEKIAVLTTLRTITPAEVTKQALEAFLVANAFQKEGGWCVAIPGFDTIDSFSGSPQDLLAEAASQLNATGVSIKGWPPYEIEEE